MDTANQGHYAQAEPLYKRSLAILEKARGPDHHDVAMSLSSLGSRYETQGQCAQAEPLYKHPLRWLSWRRRSARTIRQLPEPLGTWLPFIGQPVGRRPRRGSKNAPKQSWRSVDESEIVVE